MRPFKIIILLAGVLLAANTHAQRPQSAGYETIYSSRQNARVPTGDPVYTATLSNQGDYLLYTDFVEGRVKLVELETNKVETIKVDKNHYAAWFASESPHVFEIRYSDSVTKGWSRDAIVDKVEEMDLYCYRSLSDFSQNQSKWMVRKVNTAQFVVRWIPDRKQFLYSNANTWSSVQGPTTVYLLHEDGSVEAEIPIEGSTLNFDCTSRSISVFHLPNVRKPWIKHSQFDLSSYKKISSEVIDSSFRAGQGRESFGVNCFAGTRYIKLRDFQAGDVIDYFTNLGTAKHVAYQTVPPEYFANFTEYDLWLMRSGMRSWNLNQLAAAQNSSVPEIFRTRHAQMPHGPEFVLSRDGAYWALEGLQQITDGYFSGGKRLIVTRSNEGQKNKDNNKLVTRVIQLK